MMMALGTGGGFTKWRGIRGRKGFVFGWVFLKTGS